MSDRLPHFLGLGVQKGGTTSLHRLLEQHQKVFLPNAKELQYFSLHYAKGDEWYRSHFAEAGSNQLCGEITPYYFFHPEAHKRIAKLLPKARLIVLLRDPVDRALSQYFHSKRLGLEPLDLEEALEAEESRLRGAEKILIKPDSRHQSHQEHSYLSRSRYEKQLPNWESKFRPEQMLVLRSEDLFNEPEKTWEVLLEFLDLDPLPLPTLPKVANAGRGEASLVSPDMRRWLRTKLKETYCWAADQHNLQWSKE